MPDRLDRLAAALARTAGIDEWVATERRRQRAVRGSSGGAHQALVVEETELGASLWRDGRRGRGGAAFTVRDDADGDIDGLIAAAAARAAASVDAPWRLPPPAAPARVEVAEPTDDPPERLAEGLATALGDAAARHGAPMGLTAAQVSAERGEYAVRMSTGFAHRWQETRFAVTAALASRFTSSDRQGGTPLPGAAERIELRVRRRADLDLPAAVAAAVARGTRRNSAAATAPGRYDLVLRDDALGGNGPDFAWWAPLVAQASASLARQGLARYHPGQSIYGEHPVTGDRLTVRSDGTLPWAWDSAPLGPLGEPVRAFDLVVDGVAAGLALDLREAGRAGRTPNGGVRNLVITTGPTPLAALRTPRADRPRIEVFELAWLETNPRTGAFVAEIGLGTLATAAGEAPVSGGAFRGNVFDLFAGARLAAETRESGWFHGPAAIRFDDVDVT